MKIGEVTSRVKNLIKSVKEDAFVTDRYVYSLFLKHARYLLRRQDNEYKLMKNLSMFKMIPCYELVEVDKIEACCINLKTNCTILRTKEKLPKIMENSVGPAIRSITSIDGSVDFKMTYPTTYTAMANTSTFKYNKDKYFWYLNGHLYFPNSEIESVAITAIWEDNIAYLDCSSSEEEICMPKQDQDIPVPEYLVAEAEQLVLKDLGFTLQVPQDVNDDKQNISR